MNETTSAFPWPVRVALGGETVHELRDTIRLDRPGAPPLLFFPRAVLPEGLEATFVEGEGDLAGLVALDDDRVTLEVLDGRPGGDERDLSIKRFPTWGDATDLYALLDVQPEGEGRFVGGARGSWLRGVVEASQLLGQAVVAASRTAPGRRVVSASMVFPRVGHPERPVPIEVEELTAGRTFTTLAVRAVQDDNLCGVGTVLLDVTAADVMRHGAAMPEVAGPYDSEPVDMMVTGRDLRVVDAAYRHDPDAPLGPPVLDAWVRFRDVPDSPGLHEAVLAQFCGHMPIAAAMRPHAGIGQRQAHRTLQTGINAITISFHAPVRADEWMLYHHVSTFAGDGMTHADCQVFTADGRLVASFQVEAMVRAYGERKLDNEQHRL